MNCPKCGKQTQATIRDYEYKESGLKNVVLKNITVHKCKACSEILPEIRNINQVHRWIAEYLIKKPGPLTGEEFRFLRKAMRKSAKELAEYLGVSTVTVSRWENNQENLGGQSDRLLRMIYVAQPLLKSLNLENTMRGIVKLAKAKPIQLSLSRSSLMKQTTHEEPLPIRAFGFLGNTASTSAKKLTLKNIKLERAAPETPILILQQGQGL